MPNGKTMAKLFLIIICVCTACVHLAAKKDFAQSHKWHELDAMQNHRNVLASRQQGQYEMIKSAHTARDLEYENQAKPIQNTNNNGNYQQWQLEDNVNQLHRIKRHAGHNHSPAPKNLIQMNPHTDTFIEKLFIQFTNGDSKTMNLVQFENMMKTLNLHRMIEDNQFTRQSQHSNDEHSHSGENSNEKVIYNIFYALIYKYICHE